LVQVQIERGDALSSLKQRDNYVHGKRGFATAALLVSYDDDVRRRRRPAVGWTDRCAHYPGPSELQKESILAFYRWRIRIASVNALFKSRSFGNS
jgi:hypothetical protein